MGLRKDFYLYMIGLYNVFILLAIVLLRGNTDDAGLNEMGQVMSCTGRGMALNRSMESVHSNGKCRGHGPGAGRLWR